MPYSKSLALRVRQVLGPRRGLIEKKLFGGLGFLVEGHLLVAVWGNSLIARLGEERAALALAEPHVRVFDVTGRPMRGWVVIDPDGLDLDSEMRTWIAKALDFVEGLPPK